MHRTPGFRLLAICLVSLLPCLAGCVRPGGVAPMEQPQASRGMTQAELVERGAFLTTIGGCKTCHSPLDEEGQPIPGREFSGHPAGAPLPEWDPSLLERNILVTFAPTGTAFAGPFGVTVAGNLTPDEETGTGRLTYEMLLESWRTGQSWKHDRPILPPMPSDDLDAFSDEDILAIHTFLRSLDPVHNPAPPSQPAPPREAAR